MKKKLTLLFALLCVSVMGWATQYCGEALASTVGATVGQTVEFTASKTGELETTFSITSATSTIVGLYEAVLQNNGGGVLAGEWNNNSGWTLEGNTLSKVVAWTTYPTGNLQLHLIVRRDNSGGDSDIMGKTFTDVDVSAACGGGDPTPDPEPTPSVSPYCSTEIGHLADPNAAAGSFILLSVGSDGNGHTIVNIKQDAAKNTAMFDYINIVGKKETGSDVATGGSDEMAIMFNTPTPDGDGNITFTLQWSTVDWGGRWQINDITVPANAICENADPFPGEHTYCKYSDIDLRKNNTYAALTWETNAAGDVVITLSDGEGASGTHFRNQGFEFDGNYDKSWKVYSGTKHSVCEPASIYFNYEEAVNGGNTYALRKKDGETLPANAVVAFFGHAFSWKTDQEPNAYIFDKWFGYTYGAVCPFLAAPTNVAVDGTNHITFDAVTNAQTYTASVYLDGIMKHRQVVNNGDELTFQPYTTGTYQVEVVADAEGYPTSDPSDAYDWALTAPAIAVGNSEYCEWALPKHNNQDANLTWETGDDGAITITLSPLSEQTAVFRAEGMKLSDFTVGAARTAASAYFNRSYTAGGTTVLLTLKDANIAPGLGEKIYFSGYIECKVQDQDTWPNPSMEYTYGSKCSGQKHVTVSVNNNEMGSATVDGVAAKDVDEGTQVTCVAIPASGYDFVNWTKGGEVVSTEVEYITTITSNTALVANFELHRNVYCHTEVMTDDDRTLYLSCSQVSAGVYRIRIDGSTNAKINAKGNFNFVVNHTTDYSAGDYDENTGRGWLVSNEGNGYAQNTFAAEDYKTITFGSHYLYFIAQEGGNFSIDSHFPAVNTIAWNSTCSDAEAPVINKAEAEVLSESSVRLKIQATDNWGGLLTYTIAREAAEPIISNHASGEEFTQDITGLTTGTEYTFTVTVSDGVNNANQNIVVIPIADNVKPVMGEALLESKTWNSAIINVAATDNKGVAAYRIAELNAEFVATDGKISVEGLTQGTPYTFTITAKDAAGNESANNAVVVFTTDAHSLVPTTAAPVPTWPDDQVISFYSDKYTALTTWNYRAPWDGTTVYEQVVIAENNVIHYSSFDWAGWDISSGNPYNALTMEKLHLDIWVENDCEIGIVPIYGGAGLVTDDTRRVKRALLGQQWNSIDLVLATDYAELNLASIFQFKFDQATTTEFYLDNVYFYRESAIVDDDAPYNVSGNMASQSYFSVTLALSATDDGGAVTYIIENGGAQVASTSGASDATVNVKIDNLASGTNYVFSVIAKDGSDNAADAINVNASTLAAPAPAPTPTHAAAAVKSLYSNAYTPVVAVGNYCEWWWESPTVHTNHVLGADDNVLFYDNNHAAGASFGWSWNAGNKIDFSGYQKLHMHIYPTTSGTIEIYPVIAPEGEFHKVSQTLTAGQWNEVVLDYTEKTFAPLNQIGFVNFYNLGEFFVDNVYFFKEPEIIRNDAWMAPGELGTICIPQGAVATGGDIYELLGKDENGKIVFATRPNNEMEPGKPYLFEAKSNAMRFYYTSATPAGEPDNSGAMKGTFNEVTLTDDQLNNVYYFAGHALWSCVDLTSTGLHVSANRAWVVIDEHMPSHNTSAPMPGRRIMTMNVNSKTTPTAIDQVHSSDAVRKVILDGTLYILRGEKLYDATGRLVK